MSAKISEFKGTKSNTMRSKGSKERNNKAEVKGNHIISKEVKTPLGAKKLGHTHF